jgi:UDP-3-O-[3-hydroxymyristoyl] glucosamine N-acyltransferase
MGLPLKKFFMQFPSPVSVQWLAEFLDAELVGNPNGQATGINEIHKVEKGDLVFVDHPKYYDKCLKSEASFIIINNRNVEVPEGKALLVVDNPLKHIQKSFSIFAL